VQVIDFFNYFRHYKSPSFHTVIRIHLISLSYHILVILPSHFSSVEQMLMLIDRLLSLDRLIYTALEFKKLKLHVPKHLKLSESLISLHWLASNKRWKLPCVLVGLLIAEIFSTAHDLIRSTNICSSSPNNTTLHCIHYIDCCIGCLWQLYKKYLYYIFYL